MSRARSLLALLATCCALVACGPAPQAAPPTAAPVARQPAAAAGLARSAPTWVDVPSIGVHSTLVPLGLNPDRTVEVPPVDQPRQAGWYSGGPTPGELGPAVVLGHIDGHHQQGIFWRLHEMKPGAKIGIGRADGSTLSFVVYKVDQVAKKSFPTGAVYGDTTRPEIRLITCGGAYDPAHHNYLDNILVYGALA